MLNGLILVALAAGSGAPPVDMVLVASTPGAVAVASADPCQQAWTRALAEGKDFVVWSGGYACAPCEAALPNAVHWKTADSVWGASRPTVFAFRLRRDRRGFDKTAIPVPDNGVVLPSIQQALAAPTQQVGADVCPCCGGTGVVRGTQQNTAGAAFYGQSTAPLVLTPPFAASPGMYAPAFSNFGGGGCAGGNCAPAGRFRR
jgi:hypothetical protein